MISVFKALPGRPVKLPVFIKLFVFIAVLTGCGSSSTDDAGSTVKSWHTPQLISASNGNGQNPQIAMDAYGNAIVVLYEYGFGVYAAHYFKNTGWLAPVPITELRTTIDVWDWQIAMASDGNAISVRRQLDGSGHYRIWTTRYYAGNGWGSEQDVQSSSTMDNSEPRIVMDNNSNAVAIWVEGSSSPTDIRANTYSSISGWNSSTTEIDNHNANTGSASLASVAMGSNGEAYVVMQQVDSTTGQNNINFNRYVPGTGWGSASLVDNLSGDADYPKIAVDGSNNAISIWRQADGSSTNLYASYRPAGGSWEAQETIEAIDGIVEIDPVIVMNSSGTAFAAWIQADGTTYSVYANRFTPTDGWGTAQLLETSNNLARQVDVAVDVNGNAVVVWSQNTTNNFRIYRNHYTIGSGWDSAELMENNAGKEAYLPKVIFDNSGNAIAVWGVLDPAAGNTSKVWASRFN